MLRKRFFQKYIWRSFSHDIYSKQNKQKFLSNNDNVLLQVRKLQSVSIKKFEQYIENINKPKCKDCIYFYPHITNKNKNNEDIIIYNKSFCTKFGQSDIISGKINYYNIIDIRHNTNKCGENGIYFELKSKK
jgi:hypothetical protein